MWKYWLTMIGWKLNAWFHALGLHRLPLFGALWFNGKRLVGRWLASGRGVPVRLDGETSYVHPFTIVYSVAEWEPYTEKLFQETIKPGSTVLDIGAHHGYFSLLAARCVGEEGRVYAFEPAPENFEVLKTNVELNHLTNVFPVNKAVSDKSGTAPFFIEKPNDVQGSLFHGVRPNGTSVPVECITIDGFLNGQPVDVVKMDIEGGEPLALEGMAKTLSQNSNIVLFLEFHGPLLRRAGGSPEDLLAQLDKAGFACQIINDERRCLQPLQLVVTREEGFYHGFCNIVCVKKEAAFP